MKYLWASAFLFIAGTVYGQERISYAKVDEAKLQWGAEVNGVKAAVEIGNLRQADNKKISPYGVNIAGNKSLIPLLVHIKNVSDKTFSVPVFGSFLGMHFYTLDCDGALGQIEVERTDDFIGSVGFFTIKPNEILTIEIGFPVAWLGEIKEGLVIAVGLQGTDGSIKRVFSQPIKTSWPPEQMAAAIEAENAAKK